MAAEPVSRSGVTLHLERLEDLFSPPEFGEFGGSADVPSGIERLVTELKTSSGGGQVTVVIPDAASDPEVQERVRLAIRRYAALRVRELQHRRAALRRDGLTSLLYAVPVVAALSLLSVLVTSSNLGEEWRTAIDGLVIVLEWVALWYPLDALFWYGRPVTQELNVLRRLERETIAVRAAR